MPNLCVFGTFEYVAGRDRNAEIKKFLNEEYLLKVMVMIKNVAVN